MCHIFLHYYQINLSRFAIKYFLSQSSYDHFPLHVSFDLFPAKQIVGKLCEKDELSPLWRASLNWRGSGWGCIHIEMVRSGWHTGPFILTTWDLLVTYFCTFTWVDFSPNNFTSTWVKFKWHSPMLFCISINPNICQLENINRKIWRLETANPSCWVILGVMRLQLVIQHVYLLQSEESLTWLQPETGRVSCPCRLPGWSSLHYPGLFQPETERG